MLMRFMFLRRWLDRQSWFREKYQYLYEAKLIYRSLPLASQDAALFWMTVGCCIFPPMLPNIQHPNRDRNLNAPECKCAKAGSR